MSSRSQGFPKAQPLFLRDVVTEPKTSMSSYSSLCQIYCKHHKQRK